jgi:hypothetical protein
MELEGVGRVAMGDSGFQVCGKINDSDRFNRASKDISIKRRGELDIARTF